MLRFRAGLFFVACVTLLIFPVAQAELLGHISEDDNPEVINPADIKPEKNRQIIYRVICTPEGEQLPDCEQTVTDHLRPTPPAELPNTAETVVNTTADQTRTLSKTVKKIPPTAKAKTRRHHKAHKHPHRS